MPSAAEPQPMAHESAEVRDSDAGAAAATVVPEERPAIAVPPAPQPPLEHVMGWVADTGSPEAVEATPLDLEELDLSEAEGPMPEGIQLEQPVTLEDSVQPIAGLVGRDDDVHVGSFDHVTDFRVETAEDIVLNSSGGSEFQVANAAEELLGLGDPPPSQVTSPPADAASTRPTGSDFDAGTPRLDDALPPIAMESEEPAPAEPTGTASLTSEADREPTVEAATAPSSEEVTAEAPVPDWARPMHAAEEPETAAPASASAEWTPPWSRPREPEPPAEAVTSGAQDAPASPAEPAEPDVLVTASMAELLLQQGHAVEALTVYRLLETRGGEPRYHEKIAELERLTAPPAPPEPSAPAAAAMPSKAYSVQETKGQSARAFLQALLAARPPAIAGNASVHSTAARPGTADPAGAPTRPAHDSLSLSSVFGEESGPTHPAVPAAGASAPGGGVSYDEFFSGSGSAPAVRPARAPDSKSDDLDQFHAWLQNLKR
jgi:hypothetical protein